MKSFRYIALGAILTFGILSAVFYSSCSKDSCGAVTCLNKVSCSGGLCQCDPKKGIGGANCEIIFRNLYNGAYHGYASGTAGHSDSISALNFTPDNDTSDLTTMHVAWVDTMTQMFSLPIGLSNNSSTGSTFTVTPTTVNDVTFTGAGNITPTAASMDITETYLGGGTQILHFYSFSKQ